MSEKKLGKVGTPSHLNDEIFVYSLDKINKTFDNVEVLLKKKMIVAYNDSDCWYDFVFLTWVYTDVNSYYQHFCKISGPSDERKCKHVNFSSDGYFSYLSRDKMESVLDFIEKYYDI